MRAAWLVVVALGCGTSPSGSAAPAPVTLDAGRTPVDARPVVLDASVDAGRRGAGREGVHAHHEDRVVVAEQHDRHVATTGPHGLDGGKRRDQAAAGGQRTLHGSLDDRAVGAGVRERHAEFDDVGPGSGRGEHDVHRGHWIGIAEGEVGDERGALFRAALGEACA